MALGISTGFSEGSMRCLDELIKALQRENEALFFFQNYLTLPMTGNKSQKYKKLWDFLKNETPKLLVLDSASKDGDEAEGEAEKLADKTPESESATTTTTTTAPAQEKGNEEEGEGEKLADTTLALESGTTITSKTSVTKKRPEMGGKKKASASKRKKLESGKTTTTTTTTTASAPEKKEKLNNANTVQQLIEHPADFPAVTSLLFTPYTGKKFHHKLVIQYPVRGDPVVYTGSFHLSNSAIEQNSEMIIGIQSQSLAQEYLAPLLWQSGLGQETKVWEFMNLHSALFINDQYLTETARKIYALTHKQMDGYLDRVAFMLNNLLASSSLQDIKPALKGHNEQITQEVWQKSNAQKRLTLLQAVKKTVFDQLSGISHRLADSVKLLTSSPGIQQSFPLYTSPQAIPDPQAVLNWIYATEQWVSEATAAVKKYKQSKASLPSSIADNIHAVNSLMSHLKNAYNYPDSFVNLIKLYTELSPYGQPQSSAVTVAGETLQPSSPYNAKNLSSFLHFLKTTHDFKTIATTVGQDVDHVTPQLLGRIASDQRFGAEEKKEQIWQSLARHFEKELHQWQQFPQHDLR